MRVSIWENCYSDNWQGLIVPEAFCHPAKFSPGLIRRIYRHCIEQGYVEAGDVVVDPFAGIGGGGMFAPMFGLKWQGVELEEKFVELANKNFRVHMNGWKSLNHPFPVIIQGDSRRLADVLQGADLIATSPPYIDSLTDPRLQFTGAGGPIHPTKYGKSPGQIGQMKPGSLADVCVTSPPYADGCRRTGAEHDSQPFLQGGKLHDVEYSSNPANIGNLKAGDADP